MTPRPTITLGGYTFTGCSHDEAITVTSPDGYTDSIEPMPFETLSEFAARFIQGVA